jgi:hypothetical protein
MSLRECLPASHSQLLAHNGCKNTSAELLLEGCRLFLAISRAGCVNSAPANELNMQIWPASAVKQYMTTKALTKFMFSFRISLYLHYTEILGLYM